MGKGGAAPTGAEALVGLAQMVLHRAPGSPIASVLVEVDGYVADDDKRLADVPRQKVVLGGYAVPIGDNA